MSLRCLLRVHVSTLQVIRYCIIAISPSLYNQLHVLADIIEQVIVIEKGGVTHSNYTSAIAESEEYVSRLSDYVIDKKYLIQL